MVSLDISQKFILNRILLAVIGLWPYQEKKIARPLNILCFAILSSFILFQFTTFVTTEFTLDFVIKVFSIAMIFITYLILYNSFYINSQHVIRLLEQVQHVYKHLKDENEIAIIIKYWCTAKRYTTRLILVGSMFLITIQPIWPKFLYVVPLTNESRPRSMDLIMTEYFINSEKYIYLILLHMFAAFFIGVFTTVGVGTIFLTFTKHLCGMFSIASYRIEQAINSNIQRNCSRRKKQQFKEFIHAVDIHRKAMELSKSVLEYFEAPFCIFVINLVICLSLNLYRVFHILTFGNDVRECSLHIACIIAIIIFIFLANYAIQEIMDHNSNIFLTAYNTRWYIKPLYIQRLILLLLQRGNKPFILKIGGMFVLSLQYFATMMSTSMSYFTVLYTTQF